MTNTEREELGQFLFERLETLEQLQTLLWVHQMQVESHTIADISAALHVPVPMVTDAVRRLCDSGLIRAEEGKFRYAPADESLRSSVERLVAVYAEDWSTVLQLLSANAIRRIRTSVMGAFSDAFVIKGKK